jgi:hypothetical protein
METIKNSNIKKNALTAGLLYLVIIVVGMYAFVYALPQIKIEGDIGKTVVNIKNNSLLFRIGIISILAMNIASILLALYLYKLLSVINKGLAMSMLSLLFVGAGISLINEINHFAMIIINNMDNYNSIEKHNLTHLFVQMQKHGSYIAVIFWGLWLFPLGCLIFSLKTRISKFIGIMLIIAGVGYVLDSFFLFVFPEMKIPSISDYTFIGEFLLTIWLLVKSRTIEKLVRTNE